MINNINHIFWMPSTRNYRNQSNPQASFYTPNNIKSDCFCKTELSFTGRVPKEIKLDKKQYAVSNALSNKEAAIASGLYQSLPAIVQLEIANEHQRNNVHTNFKEVSKLKEDLNNLSYCQGLSLLDKSKNLIAEPKIQDFAQKGQELEKSLFAQDFYNPDLKKQVDSIFAKYNLGEINTQGAALIEQSKNKSLKDSENQILERIINDNPLSEDDKNYSASLKNVFDESFPEASDLDIKEKAQIIRLMNTLDIDAATLAKDTRTRFLEIKETAKNKKESLNYADEPPYTDEEIEKFFNGNKAKAIKTILVIGSQPLNFLLDKKIDKTQRIFDIVNSSENTNETLRLLHAVTSKIKQPHDIVKITELLYGYQKLNNVATFEEKLKNISQSKKVSSNDILNTSNDYMHLLLQSPNINNKNFNLDLAYTIPAAYDRFDVLQMHNHKEYLTSLLSLISPTKDETKTNYLNYIHNPNTDIGKSNKETKEQFSNAGLNFDTWINYDKKAEFTDEQSKQNFGLNVWERNVGYDLFQGNYSGICIATNGKNAFGSVDALINEAVQIIEITKGNETIGNAYTYFGLDANNTPAFVLDGVSLDNDYKDNNSIKENLLSYAYDYASAVKGDENFKFYIGDNYNSINTDEYKPQTISITPIGSTGERKYYLDSMTRAKYVTIDGNTPYFVDVKQLKPMDNKK